jgi:hypothetical protein
VNLVGSIACFTRVVSNVIGTQEARLSDRPCHPSSK